AEDGIRDYKVTGVQTCALPICAGRPGGPGHAGDHDVPYRKRPGALRPGPRSEVRQDKRYGVTVTARSPGGRSAKVASATSRIVPLYDVVRLGSGTVMVTRTPFARFPVTITRHRA